MQEDNVVRILPVLIKHKNTIAATTILTMAMVAIVVLLLPDYFQASTVFYPTSNALLKPVPDPTGEDMYYFGDGHDIDRLLAIAVASKTRHEIAQELHLASHYEIDTTKISGRKSLMKRLQNRYKATKTKYDGIEISFEDQNPEFAAAAANTIREIINNKLLMVIKSAQAQLYKTIQASVNKNGSQLDSLTAKMQMIQKRYKIYDLSSQGEALAALQAKSPGDKRVIRMIDDFTEGAAKLQQLTIQQQELAEKVAKEKAILDQMRAFQDQEMRAIHTVEPASVPIEKSRPHRSLIVMASGILAFSLTLVCIFYTSQAEMD